METENCIFFQLSRVSRAGARHWQKRVSAFGVTAAQSLVLMFLLEQDRVTSKILGSRIEFDSATLTGLLDRLVAGGMVVRENNPEDRRAILISLTSKGRQTAKKIQGLVEQENQAFLSGLTPEEALILRVLLKKIK